jgi:stage V sporulation protein B
LKKAAHRAKARSPLTERSTAWVFPLILFSSAILYSFASLLVPEVAEAKEIGDDEKIGKIVNTVFGTALFFSLGTAGIIMCFSYELGNVVYPGTDAGKYIQMIAPLIPVMYLDTAVDAMLKGLGFQVYSMGVNIADALVSVILVIILLQNTASRYIITVY